MAHISFRIDQELFDKIESLRGDTDRTKYLRDIIVAHIEAQGNTAKTQNSTDETQSSTTVLHLNQEIERLLSENKMLLAVQKEKEERIKDLQTANGFYIQQVQKWENEKEAWEHRALYPSQEEQKKNPWWKFW